MRTFNSIQDCADFVADYLTMNVNSLPENLQEPARAANRAISPVDRVVNGMELLLAIVESDYVENEATALEALHAAAHQVANGGFWNKGNRAVQVMAYARHKAGEWPKGLDAPATPELDSQFAHAPAPAALPGWNAPTPAPESEPSAD